MTLREKVKTQAVSTPGENRRVGDSSKARVENARLNFLPVRAGTTGGRGKRTANPEQGIEREAVRERRRE